MKANLFIVDDDANTLASLSRAFRLAGHEATVCDNPVKALETIKAEKFDVIFSDVVMPAMNGMECLQALRAIDPNVRVILSSGYGDGEIPGVEFLPKPYQPEQLAGVVRRAIRKTTVRASAN